MQSVPFMTSRNWTGGSMIRPCADGFSKVRGGLTSMISKLESVRALADKVTSVPSTSLTVFWSTAWLAASGSTILAGLSNLSGTDWQAAEIRVAEATIANLLTEFIAA